MKTITETPVEFTVLLVEDNDKYRLQLAEYLRGEGFKIVETNSSREACALIRERKASIVVLDWDLQNHNFRPDEPSTGLTVLQTCHEVDPLLPVVVMSGAGVDLDPQGDSLMAGADCFLKKDFPNLLVNVVLHRWKARLKAEKNPFTQLTAGIIETSASVNRKYARAVVDKVGSVLQAAPKLGLSRQTIASYLASPSHP